ncbi:hypothetical protein [Rhizobium sp. L51/94]|uniref:hypothetical protein n=1 Tax=Rhizobium sp. L51/94 TaxID=2819999 RepID=UPI001C5AA9D7|nr:hypothetical protein [Rhizobium sp. L51/94]QXZ79620.1 hypothetical protein J5274_06455 [Rhizobium sp. L51/94]
MSAVDRRHDLSDLHEVASMVLDCAEPAFKVYLHEIHGMAPPLTDDNAVAWIFRWLRIHSFTEIRTNATAREVWAKLRNDFKEWRTQ